jgi:hypothetical protein
MEAGSTPINVNSRRQRNFQSPIAMGMYFRRLSMQQAYLSVILNLFQNRRKAQANPLSSLPRKER